MRNFKFEETGEVRPPLAGEWFRGNNGCEIQARFDFAAQSFPILRVTVVEEPKGDGDGA